MNTNTLTTQVMETQTQIQQSRSRANTEKPSTCKNCPLYHRPLVKSKIIKPDTNKNNCLWIVGEAPGYTEAAKGKPFVGTAGKFLRETLQLTGLDKFPLVITNACLCHPPHNNTPSIKAVRLCKYHLEKLARQYPPALIIALGKTAAKALNIPDKAMKELRGGMFQTEYGPCLVTYHPSRILRTKYRLKGIFIEDLRKACAIAKGKTEPLRLNSNISILTEEKDIIRFILSIPQKEPVAIDVETSLPDENGNFKPHGLDPYHPDIKIYSIAIAFRNQTTAFPVDWPEKLNGNPENIKNELKKFLKSHTCLIAHNSVFELKMFRRFLKIAPSFTHDTMILAYLLKEDMQGFYSLEALIRAFFPTANNYKEEKSKNLLEYNAKDAYFCLLLYRKLSSEIKNLSEEERNAIYKAEQFILKNIVPVVAELELAGIKVDVNKLNSILNKSNKILRNLKEKIKNITGINNPRSKAFKEKLYQMYEYEPIFTEKGELSTSKETLLEIYENTDNEDLKKLILLKLSFNSLDKTINTYLKKYPSLIHPVTGRIHPSYHITGTRTGRLSCSNPNLQQIPRDGIKICPDCLLVPLNPTDPCPQCGKTDLVNLVKISDLIIPEPENVIISADYSQIEVRVMAHLSEDEKLIEAIKKGVDIHSYIASELYNIPYEEIIQKKDTDPAIANLRQNTKSVVFGFIYGMTPHGLAKKINRPVEEAKQLIKNFYDRFPGIQKYIEKIHQQTREKKRVITETGRIRRFPLLTEDDLRKAQNFPVQSLASDITQAAARKISLEAWKERIPLRIINLVHDDIKMEVPVEKIKKTEQIIKYCMINWAQEKFKLRVPLDVDIKITLPSSINAGSDCV